MRGAIVAWIAWSIAVAAQVPPRDTPGQARVGAAAISGIIVSDEREPRPLRRVRVMLNSPELPHGRTTVTNDDGTFAFDRLPPGRYTVGATKDAYLFVNYGASGPGRPGTPIVLRQGQSRQLTIRLTRGSVVTGMVTAKDGQPVPGVLVLAVASRYVPAQGERRPQPAGASTSVTDDRGVYRIFGLQPGDYMVAATVQRSQVPFGELQRQTEVEIRRALADVRDGGSLTRSTPGFSVPQRGSKPAPPLEPRRSLTYAPVYFPGTTNPALAVRVKVGKAEERVGVDIALDLVPTSRVEGRVINHGTTMQPTIVTLAPAPAAGAFDGGFRGTAPVQPDGSFLFRAVPPGQYIVMARSTVRPTVPGGRATTWTASSELRVDGDDVGSVMLSMEPGVTIAGRVAFEGTRDAPDLSRFPMVLPPLNLTGGTLSVLPMLNLDASGRFTLEHVTPGVYRTNAMIPGTRTPLGAWWLKSIAIDGQDILDTPLELRTNTNDAIVTFSDRASSLSGVVRDTQGNPAPDIHAVVFSANRRSWFHNSRRVAGVKTDANGRYTVRNLPPGEYFLMATADVEPGEWFDVVFLEQVATGATRVSIGEYADVVQDAVIR